MKSDVFDYVDEDGHLFKVRYDSADVNVDIRIDRFTANITKGEKNDEVELRITPTKNKRTFKIKDDPILVIQQAFDDLIGLIEADKMKRGEESQMDFDRREFGSQVDKFFSDYYHNKRKK